MKTVSKELLEHLQSQFWEEKSTELHEELVDAYERHQIYGENGNFFAECNDVVCVRYQEACIEFGERFESTESDLNVDPGQDPNELGGRE